MTITWKEFKDAVDSRSFVNDKIKIFYIDVYDRDGVEDLEIELTSMGRLVVDRILPEEREDYKKEEE